jgi:hypothetical protein
MWQIYAFIALDRMHELHREAEERRLADQVPSHRRRSVRSWLPWRHAPAEPVVSARSV